MSAAAALPRAVEPGAVVLARFQQDAVTALTDAVATTQRAIAGNPAARAIIGRARGACLLEAPTGSGKTLMLGRTLERLTNPRGGALAGWRGSVWFWFTPFSGLVAQTRLALAGQCGSLRGRDLTHDRDPRLTRDGDVFVQTWGAVAARNQEARRLRRAGERMLSLDEMIEELRRDGWFIGAVIDEAHLNFGVTARQAAAFYLETLKPDATILATATPRDEALDAFRAAAGVDHLTRVQVARDDVVAAGLNKMGLVAAHVALPDRDRRVIDPEEATLAAAWRYHNRVKARLAERGLPLTPLMLVQVQDQAEGGADPVGQARDRLKEIGVPEAAVAVHTSGQPDPHFHALASDQAKEVLVFKLAAATGFDAPRAWTLASLRPSLTPEFGLQVVGRIMRVHPLVRPFHGTDPLLDRAYVFLLDPATQGGLDGAVTRLRAMRACIEPVTEQLTIVEVTTGEAPPPGAGAVETLRPQPRPDRPADAQVMAGDLVEEIDRAVRGFSDPGTLFVDLPEQAPPGGPVRVPSQPSRTTNYPLRAELGLPTSLWRETLPDAGAIATLAEDAAAAFVVDDFVWGLSGDRGRTVDLKLQELFSAALDQDRVFAPFSRARLAEAAQAAFRFSDEIDPRQFRAALVARLQREFAERGQDLDTGQVRRIIDLIAYRQPERLEAAMQRALAAHVRVVQEEPIPAVLFGPAGLTPARKGAHGVYPPGLNGPERTFAQALDADDGVVLWWLRNESRQKWAVQIVLPNGKMHYPDFVVGVRTRPTPDHVRLAEVKDDGTTGRLHALENRLKIQRRHERYSDVLWVCQREADGEIVTLIYNQGLRDIVPDQIFRPALLV